MFAGLLVRLHEAADAGRGADVIHAAEQVLAVAPQHPRRQRRGQAWKAVEPATVALREAPAEPSPRRRSCRRACRIAFCCGSTGSAAIWSASGAGQLRPGRARFAGGRAAGGRRVADARHAEPGRRRLRPGGDAGLADQRPAGDAGHAAARRPRDARCVVPAPVSAAGPAQRHRPPGPGERPSVAAGRGRRAGDGRDADPGRPARRFTSAYRT